MAPPSQEVSVVPGNIGCECETVHTIERETVLRWIDLLIREAASFASRGDRENFVASKDDLIEMKRDAGRPQDLLDAETLEQIKKDTEER